MFVDNNYNILEAFLKTNRYFLTIALPLAAFIFIMIMVINNNTDKLDNHVYGVISRFITPGLTEFLKIITFLGSFKFLSIFAAILIIFILVNKRYSFYISMIILNLVLSALFNEGMKHIIQRSRPEILRLIEINGYSFPSGHSMVSMSFYGLIIYICYKNCKTNSKYITTALLSILILLIGVSRIYLGVHYVSDVLGGFCLGIAWIGVFSIILDLRDKKEVSRE